MPLRPLFPVLVPAAAAAVYGWAVFVTTFSYPGAIGLNYNAPGTDWMVLYSAVRLALAGRFALLLNGSDFTAYLNATFANWLSAPLVYRPWVYPPGFLVVLLPFGAFGFTASYVAFQLTGAAILVGALLHRPDHAGAAPLVALAAIVSPAASINADFGQCGFLVAGVLILGFRLLTCRPLLAGAVLGLLSVKPQFGLMVPVALLALRQWRALGGAAGAAVLIAAVSAIVFGPDLWMRWMDWAAHTSDSQWGSFGLLWGNSIDACAVLLGAGPRLGFLIQAVGTAAAAGCVYRAFRLQRRADQRLAVLLACTLLAAPHVGPYDGIMLTVAGLLWLVGQPAPRPGHGVVLLVLWLLPMMGPPAIVPIGRIAPLVVFGFVLLGLQPSAAGVTARSESDPQAAAPSG